MEFFEQLGIENGKVNESEDNSSVRDISSIKHEINHSPKKAQEY